MYLFVKVDTKILVFRSIMAYMYIKITLEMEVNVNPWWHSDPQLSHEKEVPYTKI